MDTESDVLEYSIAPLDNFVNLEAGVREKEANLAESLASTHFSYEVALSKAHDFFGGNYETFLKSFCCAKLQLIEVEKITRKYQQEKCRDLSITAEELHTTTVGRLTDQFKDDPENCRVVLLKKENLKKQVSRKLGHKLQTFKDEWVRA